MILRRARLPFFLLPFSFCILVSAAPPADLTPDDLVRRGNALFPARDDPAEAERLADADRLYAGAEELTADPGLVGKAHEAADPPSVPPAPPIDRRLE